MPQAQRVPPRKRAALSGGALATARALVRALRAKLPQRFSWDFRFVEMPYTCGTVGCAIGLARKLNLDIDGLRSAMGDDAVDAIFFGHQNSRGRFVAYPHRRERGEGDSIRRQDVATALSHFIKTGELTAPQFKRKP